MAACHACSSPLVLLCNAEDSDSESQTVPDDLQLPCGCHYHWQCLLDQSAQVALSLTCPSCGTYLPANTAGPSVTNPFLAAPHSTTIPTQYRNEGGLQADFDILPTITEEAYLSGHPEARPARAFHVMCAEGDLAGIIELLQSLDGGSHGMGAAALLRYQDPLNGMRTGLHLAIQRGQQEVVWLLLWLASSLSADLFPEAAVKAAQSTRLPRGLARGSGSEDIRSLKDDQYETPADYAKAAGGQWRTYGDQGVFDVKEQ